MWVLIDNYDSFTHILGHYLQQLHPEIMVVRNDAVTVEELAEIVPERIIISPGPQTPREAGITLDVIAHFHQTVPILGICLGHQALGLYFGAKVNKAIRPVHGKVSVIEHCSTELFQGLPNAMSVMRYHSLVVEEWPEEELMALAFSAEGELMAMQHRLYPCTGIQFHPESVLTEQGMDMLLNWDRICRERTRRQEKTY